MPSVEIICQWIYEDARSGGVCISYCLVAIESVNNKVVQRKEVISGKQSIHSRDKIVKGITMWRYEIDSVVGTFNQVGIERKSRYNNMARLVKNKTGDETLLELLEMLLVHKKKIKTITSDNGVGICTSPGHSKWELNAQYYFC